MIDTSPAATAVTSESLTWDTELFVLQAEDRNQLRRRCEQLGDFLDRHPTVVLKDLAFTLNAELPNGGLRVAIIAKSIKEFQARLHRAMDRLADPNCHHIRDSAGLYFAESPLHPAGKIAFLFPGEGAQYLGMLADLRDSFPEVRDWFEECDRLVIEAGMPERALGRLLFLPPDATEEQRAEAEVSLRQLGVAMNSVLMADWAIFRLFGELGLRPDTTAGHSMGELAALWAAEGIEADPGLFARMVETMDQLQREEQDGDDAGSLLLAVGAGREQIEAIIKQVGAGPDVYVAMDNCPHQAVVVGAAAPMASVEAEIQTRRMMCERLPFRRPYHTPLFDPWLPSLAAMFEQVVFQQPKTPIYSCSSAEPFPPDAEEIRRLTIAHWASPVRFTEMIRRMYDDGVRIFIESGPRGNLTTFAEDILRGRPALTVAANVPRRSGPTQLNHLAGQLAVHGVPLRLTHFYETRQPRWVEWESPSAPSAPDSHGAGVASELRSPLPPTPRESSTAKGMNSSKRIVMDEYLGVMDQFLDLQQQMMENFLTRRGRGTGISRPAPAPAPVPTSRPMIGEIVRHVPGREVVMRRRLDINEDVFAAHHTVGGRGASKVDPDQNGFPVLPMTFNLEMMAEVGELLFPDKVVRGFRNVRLMRWLPYDVEEPTTVEVTAKFVGHNPDGTLSLAVESRDLGNATRPATSKWVAAQATLLLADHSLEAPVPGEFPLTDEHPCRISLEVLYKNLFHGPLFQGVRHLGRTGAESIESDVEILPRQELYRSIDEPNFIMDPVLMDVGMHPFAAWHLEQEDQSGRILLPVELKEFDVFGPKPTERTRLISRGWIEDQSHRHFTHAVEFVGPDGRLWARMRGARYWRFYVPFGEVNFHGPKDEYFLSKEWSLPFRAVAPIRQNGDSNSKPTGSLMKLVLRPDILQVVIRTATGCVSLSPNELAEFRHLTGTEKQINEWLYRRIVSKDAIRTLWWLHSGERMFPADIGLELDHWGHGIARRRDQTNPPPFAQSAVAYVEGSIAVGFATFGDVLGVGAEKLKGDEWDTRRRCAVAAVSQALRIDADQVRLIDEDQATGQLRVEAQGRSLMVESAVDEGHVVAVTEGQTA